MVRYRARFVGFMALFFVMGVPRLLLASSVEDLFWAKKWQELNIQASADLSPRELSLVANGLWLQGRWAESLAVMDRVGDGYPQEVVPYAEMIRVLGLERTGRKRDAYDRALSLYESRPPKDLQYYVCYALSRLTGNLEERRKWLRRMGKATLDPTLRAQSMEALMELPGPSLSDASATLKLRPLNPGALKVFEATKESRERSYRLGYAAYLMENYRDAIKHLKAVPMTGPFAQSSLYYRSMSLYKLKIYNEALPLLSRLIFMPGSDYVSRGCRRVALIAGRGDRKVALDILYRASRELSGDAGAVASSAYAKVVTGEKKTKEENRILQEYPSSKASASILWDRAWEHWEAEEYQEALGFFKRGVNDRGEGLEGHLYWAGRCLEKLERSKEADAVFKKLARYHPLSVYAYLAFPDGPSPMVSDVAPLVRAVSELERWGFVPHAEIRFSSSSDPQDRYNAARLASWLGREEEAYRAARQLVSKAVSERGVSKELAQYLYPRPFRGEVEAAARRFEVETFLIWAIMRQESAFNPSAVSWVGASGLMQLMPATAKWEAKTLGMKKYDVFSVSDNITLGTTHIARLLKSYRRLEWALAAYNAGSGNVNKWNKKASQKPLDLWMENIPFTETRGYVKRVLANLFVYRHLYGVTPKDQAKVSK